MAWEQLRQRIEGFYYAKTDLTFNASLNERRIFCMLPQQNRTHISEFLASRPYAILVLLIPVFKTAPLVYSGIYCLSNYPTKGRPC